jgi:hypothetical protein
MQQHSHLSHKAGSLHESWALAGLMRAIYGKDALPQAMMEARKTEPDHDTAPIWLSVVECLSC